MGRRRKMAIRPSWNGDALVRSLVHGLGYRFRLYDAELPGCPHLVFKSKRIVVFTVDCLTYQHEACGKKNDSGHWYYRDLKLNAHELEVICGVLAARGWICEVIWECEMRDHALLEDRLVSVLG
jgi:DNA mismatch endonuclease (patch repair protein)